jgi:anti-anti-sigma factor
MPNYPPFKILQPQGLLDSDQGKMIYREVVELLEEDIKLIVLDCQGIEFIDSSGLGVLVRLLKTIEQEEGRLVLCGLNENFSMLLKMTRMEDVFEIYASQVHFRLVLEQFL